MGSRGNLGVRQIAASLAGYGLWMVILVLAFFLQVVPVLLVVAMFTLAVGMSVGVEFVAVPLIVLAIVLVGCLIAARTRQAPTESLTPIPELENSLGYK